MEDGLEIVVGTYEEFLLGYKLDNTGPEWKLVQSFATHAHTSSVRSVASAGPFLASGGADDKIIIHDMKNRTESRVLLHHSGTVNAVAFAEGGTHLLSGGADGSFTITRTGNWQIEKHWPKAHGGSPVSYISVHPSNKLALTLGEDRTLRTWNLIKGRKAYVINLNSKGTAHALSVTWGPEGQHFALTGYNDISVWAVSNASIKHVLKCPSKSICMVFITEELAAVGLESGEIMMFNLESGNSTTLPAHTQRVKAITYSNGYLFSASSSGHIIVWKVKAKKMSLIEKCSVSTGCRITDITLIKPFEGLIKKEEDAPVQKETESIENENSENIKKESKKRKLSEESPPEVVIAEDTKVMRKRSYVPFVSVSLDNETKDKSPPKAESIENKNSENIEKKSKKRKLSEECPPEVVIAEDTKVMCKRSYIPLVSAKAYKKKKGNKNKNKKN